MIPHFLSSPRAAPLQALLVHLLGSTADQSPVPSLLGQVPPAYAGAAAAYLLSPPLPDLLTDPAPRQQVTLSK